MKVLITNGWHDDNKGDCGIILGIIEALEIIGSFDVSILSEFSKDDYRFRNGYRHILRAYPNTKIIPSSWPIFPVEKKRHLSKSKFFERIINRLSRKLNQKKEHQIVSRHLEYLKSCLDYHQIKIDDDDELFFEEIKSADLVISKGGSFIFSGKFADEKRLIRVLYPLYIALMYKKHVILLSQSICDIEGEFSRKIVYPILRESTVYVREKISQDYLQEIFNIKVKVLPDCAFVLSDKEIRANAVTQARMLRKSGKKIIGITVRDWVFKNDNRQYINQILNLVRNICKIDDSYIIMFVAQVIGPVDFEDDRIMMDLIYNSAEKKLKRKIYLIKDDLTPYELKKLYSTFSLMLGTRLHSVIFSLISNVPGIAFSYSAHKTNGIMNMVGLGDMVFPIDNIPVDDVIKKIVEIMDDYEENISLIEKKVKQFKKLFLEEIENCVYRKEKSISSEVNLSSDDLVWVSSFLYKSEEETDQKHT